MLNSLSDAELRHLEGKAVLAAKYLALYEQGGSALAQLSAAHYRKCAVFLREVVDDGRLALRPEAVNAAVQCLLDDARMTWALAHERERRFPVLDELLQRLSRPL